MNLTKSFINKLVLLGLILLVLPSVNAVILNERVEEKCSDDQCQLEFGNPRFIRYNDELMYFKDFSTLSETNEKDIKNIQLDGVEITYTPFIIKDKKEIDIKDTNDLGLDYKFINENEQDFSKFTIEFNRLTGLTEFGLRINSNYPITYKTFEHIVEGVYTNRDPKIVEVTNLYTGGREISYVPEIDNGLKVRFDKKTNSIYFTILPSLSNEPVSIDPIITFNSTSQDGHLVFDMSPFSCTSWVTGTTVTAIAKNYGTMTEAWTITPFNTSIIPDDATINRVQLNTYRHSYSSKITSTPLDLWLVDYFYGQTDIGNLNCGDENQIMGGQGSVNWSAVTGWRIKNLGTITINKTGWTNFKLAPKWVLYGAADEAQANMRASEYAGYYGPRLIVNYSEYVPPPEEEEEVTQGWSTSIILSLIGSGMLLLFIAGKFDKDEHFMFRIFLIACSIFIMLIGLSAGITIAELSDNSTSTSLNASVSSLNTAYFTTTWVFWVGLAGLCIGLLIYSLNALKKPLE